MNFASAKNKFVVAQDLMKKGRAGITARPAKLAGESLYRIPGANRRPYAVPNRKPRRQGARYHELYRDAHSDPVVVEGLEKFSYLVRGDNYSTDNLAALIPSNFSKPNGKFPSLEISDVTERDMFGYEAIPQSKLGDKGGIWAWHGLRKLEFKVTGLDFDEKNKGADEEQRVALYFFKAGKDELAEVIRVDEIRYNLKRGAYVAYLNTNQLGAALEGIDDVQPIFNGRFEIHLYVHGEHFKTVYSFPVELCVHNTRLDKNFKNHLLDTTVSIDFGTSSTCAAVKGTGGNELITLSTMSEKITESEADFDSGYTVDEILKSITELKTIPSMKTEKRQQIKIHPLNDINSKVVYVADSPAAEDEDSLDPIAFYGYLLSRAINNPVNKKIYTSYKIAFPVKFEQGVRDKIRESLAYGIRRANQLVLGADGRARPFATFDPGGGNLDTSYGIFREAIDDELDEKDYTIQIFGCGGNERVGGEKLIHQLAYKIYLDNRDLIEEAKIPFVLPYGEKYPQGFDGLLGEIGDEISNANVSTLKEKLANHAEE